MVKPGARRRTRRCIVAAMREEVTRAAGLAIVTLYAAAIGWMFAAQPRTVGEAIGGVAAQVGAYTVDPLAFDDGLAHFRADRFVEARAAFVRADPARRDPPTQFYIAYSFYRQGWHRTHRDDALYREGLAAVEHAIAIAPAGRLSVDDPDLQMHSADELKAEFERGLHFDTSDLNPLRLIEKRK
jgi:hypothetical protein